MNIENEKEYRTALLDAIALMEEDPDIDTEEGKRLIELSDAIEQYEIKLAQEKENAKFK